MAKKKPVYGKKAAKSAKSKVKKAVKKARVKTVKSKGRRTVKRVVKRSRAKIVKTPELALDKIGEVTHYFPHVNAAAVKLSKSGISIGDKIYIKGHTTDFEEQVRSIQLDHSPITEGKKGQEIGLFVKSRVRIGDKVYKV